MDTNATAIYVAAIYHDAHPIRMNRLQRTAHMRAQRAIAIRRLGFTVRAAFAATEDFEPLLHAVVDGLLPHEARF